MHNFSESKILPFAVKELFELVLDVEEYPKFLPWIEDVHVISHEGNVIIADMTAQFKSIKQTYRSEIKYDFMEEKAMIEVTAIPGMFSHLYNTWVFTQDGKATIVNFSVDFEFQSKIIHAVASPFFESVSKKMIQAFETQARVKYERD